MRTILQFLPLALLAAGCGREEPGATATGGGGAGGATGVFRFTALPDHDTTALKRKFDPVARYLSDELGVKVEYVPAADYDASVQMFKNGDVHLAWFGGLTGVQATEAVKGARMIAMGEEDRKFRSYFVVNASTGLERSDAFPKELAKLRFTFGSEKSTSGRLMPEYFIRKETGKGPREFFEQEPGFSGAHDKTAKLVESGTYQAGVLNYQTYDTMVEKGELDPERARIAWVTPDYVDYNLVAHPELDTVFGQGFVDRVQTALVEMDDPALLRAFDRARLVKTTNAEFESVRDVAKQLDMLR